MFSTKSRTTALVLALSSLLGTSTEAKKPRKPPRISDPVNLASYANTENSITLTWESGGSETGFIVGYLEDVLPEPQCANVTPIDVGNATSYIITGLNPSTTYGFRVCAYNSSTTSDGVTLLDETLGPPPVLYEMTWIGDSYVRDVNNLGELVGSYGSLEGATAAYVSKVETSFVWTDLNEIADVPDGVHVRNAVGLNELGEVVGTAIDVAGNAQGFFYDPLTGDCIVLPAPAIRYQTYARAINDSGVIVGYSKNELGETIAVKWNPPYDADSLVNLDQLLANSPGRAVAINNGGVIVTKEGSRLTPNPSGDGTYLEEYFPGLELNHINIHGDFAGITQVVEGKRNKTEKRCLPPFWQSGQTRRG